MADSAAIDKLIFAAIRDARNNALDAAISLAEEFARTGESVDSYLRALRDLKEMLNPKDTMQ